MKKFMKKRKNQKGFTLVELLLVIAIIGILAAVLFVGLGNQRERARVTTFKENLRGLVSTFTACTDGGGTIGDGAADATVPVCSADNTAGIPQTSVIPEIQECNGSGTISITATTDAGDLWGITASCTRGDATTCDAVCNADGCEFTGSCE